MTVWQIDGPEDSDTKLNIEVPPSNVFYILPRIIISMFRTAGIRTAGQSNTSVSRQRRRSIVNALIVDGEEDSHEKLSQLMVGANQGPKPLGLTTQYM